MSRHAYWIATVFFLALVAAKFDPQTGFTSLIRFGELTETHLHPKLRALPLELAKNSHGYDGQFYAVLAVDPLLRDSTTARFLDVPAYRAHRILLPGIAATAGWGNPWRVLNIYALLNVAGWLALAWFLRRVIAGEGWGAFAQWFGCLFAMGTLDSVRQSLVDLPALLFLALGIAAAQRSTIGSGIWIALGSLTKETSCLGSLALAWDRHEWPFFSKRALFCFLGGTLPLVGWFWYVHGRVPALPADNGIGNLTWPGVGLAQHVATCVQAIKSGNWDTRYTMGLLAVLGFALQLGALASPPQPANAWWRVGMAYGVLLFLLSGWVWSGYWAVSRAVLPLTVAFNLSLEPRSRRFWPLWALGNITVLHAVWRFL